MAGAAPFVLTLTKDSVGIRGGGTGGRVVGVILPAANEEGSDHDVRTGAMRAAAYTVESRLGEEKLSVEPVLRSYMSPISPTMNP